MSFFKRFSDSIENQQWDHDKFIRNLLLIMVIVIAMFYIFVLVSFRNGIINQLYFNTSIRYMVFGNISGLITGIFIEFGFLVRYYIQKQWDLHIVVPNSLFFHVIITSILFLLLFLVQLQSSLFESALIIGYLTGGLIPILAYSGEVKKEHSDPNED